MKNSLRTALIVSLVGNCLLAFLLFRNSNTEKTDKQVSKEKPFAQRRNGNQSAHAWKVDQLFKPLNLDTNDIVLAGDSFIANFHLGEMLGNSNIKNRGIQGEFTAGLVDMVPLLTQAKPKQIVILVGINDILNDNKHATIEQNYRKVINQVRTNAPVTKLVFIGPLPMLTKSGFCNNCNPEIQEVNRKLKRICLENNVAFIDVYDEFLNNQKTEVSQKYVLDGLHINAEGYFKLKKLLLPQLAIVSDQNRIE